MAKSHKTCTEQAEIIDTFGTYQLLVTNLWSKGDYSRHIQEASMSMDGLPEGVPPSGRVPEQLLQVAPILKRRRGRYRGEFAKVRSILGVSTPRAKYRRKGAPGDPPVSQEGPWRDLGWGRATCPPGWLGVAPLPSLDFSGSFRSADFLSDFDGIFGALLMAEKPEK